MGAADTDGTAGDATTSSWLAWYPFVAVVAAFGFSMWAYDRLPLRVPIHWGIDGRANGWGSRSVGAYLLPVVLLALTLLLRFLPSIDPRRASYAKFQRTYDGVVAAFATVMLGVHVTVIGAAIGWPVSVSRVITVLIGSLFVVLGNALPRARPNWFFGIRTPWTLASDRVWERTHRLGGITFVAAGLITLGTVWLPPRTGAVAMLTAIAAASLVPIVLSYVWWAAENRRG
jgi:uncharacterized membrane protein